MIKNNANHEIGFAAAVVQVKCALLSDFSSTFISCSAVAVSEADGVFGKVVAAVKVTLSCVCNAAVIANRFGAEWTILESTKRMSGLNETKQKANR